MRNGLYIKINFFIASWLLCLCLNAQRFDSVLKRLDTEYPQEKLYLQFDRSIYNAGETIWFKGYLFSGINLSLISKTIYAELIDDKGNILQRVTAPVLESSAASSFDIPDNIQGDIVYIRAYTKWMLNFDSSFLYIKALPLVSKKPAINKAAASTTFLHFFPEGGDLIEGLPSRVAFKATDEHGIPVAVKGDIMDASGKNVQSFASIHDGMGMFTLLSENSKYKAIWKDGHGQSHETLLPVPKKQGFVIEVNNNGTQVSFKVTRSADTSSAYSEANIVAQMQHQLVYRAKGKVAMGESIKGNIPIDSLPAGILQITVFNKDEQPVAERIVFINQQDYYFITDLNPSVINTSKREKNVIQVDVPDTIGCNLSVAVTDANLNASGEKQDNIFSHVLLTGDIKGYVHNPGYYFSGEADSIVKHLDLVMMTNGWRRFNWEDVLANRWPVIKNPPEDYLSVKGKVYGIEKSLIKNRELMGILQIKNKAGEMLTTKVEDDGSFLFPGLIFYDTAQLYYQFNNDKNKDITSRGSYDIKSSLLNMPMSVQPKDAWLYGYRRQDSIVVKNRQGAEKYFAQLPQKTKVLQTVVVKGKQKSKKQLMDEQYTSGLFSGGDDYTFITEDDPFANASQTVLSYLQGKVAGLQINLAGGTPGLTWRGGSPSLFLDEMPAEIETVQSIPMNDVAMIKVFRPPFLGAFGGGSGGAIAVYYKKGASRNNTVKGLDHSAIMGYTPVKQFYSPDYPADQASPDPDLRTTLYWNPYVLTDKTHRRIFLTFYNNDVSKKFRVIIEGCNEQGKLTRIEKVFN
ncbi:MAG: hypothetical protein ABJA71_01980 [Ginsengibacter sp.]